MANKLGTQVAKAILSGDVELARSLSVGLRTVSVPEGRAISAACEVVNKKWGANLNAFDFIGR